MSDVILIGEPMGLFVSNEYGNWKTVRLFPKGSLVLKSM